QPPPTAPHLPYTTLFRSFASLSSEPAKPTLFQASIEKSDPTIAAPMTGHSVAPKPVAGQNAGPKLAAIAAALRPTVTPSTMRAASAVVLIAVSEVWMTAAVQIGRASCRERVWRRGLGA